MARLTEIGSGGDKRWSLDGATALVTGGTRGIGFGRLQLTLAIMITVFWSCFLFVEHNMCRRYFMYK